MSESFLLTRIMGKQRPNTSVLENNQCQEETKIQESKDVINKWKQETSCSQKIRIPTKKLQDFERATKIDTINYEYLKFETYSLGST